MKYKIPLLFAFTLFIACNSNNDKAKEYFLNAKKHFKAKDFAIASVEIDKAISLESTNLDFFIVSADINKALDNEDEAIRLLNIVLKENYKKDSINYKIGECYFSKAANQSDQGTNDDENLNEAIEFYDRALQENIRFYDAYIDKYKALHNKQNYEDAIITINKAYSVFPDSLNLILFRGVAKGALGDIIEELKDLTKVIESKSLDSTNTALAYRFRGLANKRIENYEFAIEDLSNSIKYNSENSYTYKDRADLYLKMKLNENACKDYRKAADLGLVKVYGIISEKCN